MAKRIKISDLIIFENDDLFAINKPPFLPSLHERHNAELACVIDLVKELNPDYQLCHRLDRETSGVMLIAKNAEAYRYMAIQFEKRLVNKIYHAITPASVNIEKIIVNLPLYTDSKRRVLISRKEGKPSVTEISTLKQYKHFTVLKCMPITGRLHQIRVHCASQNLALVADELYNGKTAYLSQIKRNAKIDKDNVESPLINRFALHAHSIEFTDSNQKTHTIVAPYAKDFEVFVKLLDKYDAP